MTRMVDEAVEVSDQFPNAVLSQRSQTKGNKMWVAARALLTRTVGGNLIVGRWQVGTLEASASLSNEELESTTSVEIVVS